MTIDQSKADIPNFRLFLTSIGIGAFLSHFTAGVVTVSLPELTRTFQASIEQTQWITTGYLLIIAVLLPIMGKLGDRYGHRRMHNTGYLLFTISSVLIALSPTLGAILVTRAVQAVGASMFQATNIALITLLMPKEKRGRTLGLISTAVALGGMSGPVVGGMISQWLSWQWLFLIHVPVSAAATYLAIKYIPATGSAPGRKVSFDSTGALLFTALVGMILFGVTRAADWHLASTEAWVVSCSALIVLWLFSRHSRHHSSPFLPLQMLREPVLSSGLFVSLISFLLVNSVQVILPFYLTESTDMTLWASGTLMAVYPVSLAVCGPVAGWPSDKLGTRLFPLLGLTMIGAGLLLFVLLQDRLAPVLTGGLLVLLGAGMGMIASPNSSLIMSSIASSHAGMAGGLLALSRNLGMAFGASVGLGSVQDSTYNAVFVLDIFLCISAILVCVFAGRMQQHTIRSEIRREK
ncbi:MFS transporter [Paenibacillus enshidis]|uniref:MFS transporter n=1 Tax=Paenibacillus enshidis TaxID=1458439 RepID=A0ABV5AT85_9BACL